MALHIGMRIEAARILNTCTSIPASPSTIKEILNQKKLYKNKFQKCKEREREMDRECKEAYVSITQRRIQIHSSLCVQ